MLRPCSEVLRWGFFSLSLFPFFFSITWERRRLNLHPGWRNKRQGHPSERKRCVGLSSSVVSLSPGSQLNTRLCSTIQAARLRLGGSGLQTMSNIREQSFSASVTSNAGAGVKSKLHIRETLANLHMNVAIFQDKLKAPQSIGRRDATRPRHNVFALFQLSTSRCTDGTSEYVLARRAGFALICTRY